MVDLTPDIAVRTTPKPWSARLQPLQALLPLLAVALLVGVWDLWVRVADVSDFILPAPAEVARRMVDHFDVFMPRMWTTLELMLSGFGLAVGIGIALAILIVTFRRIELTIYPVLVASQVIPKIAIAPVIFIWFGLELKAKLILVFLLAFFPVVIASVVGLKSLEATKLHLARSLGAGKFDILFRFRLPQALPDMFAGIKLAATRAVGAAVVAEFITPGTGLGNLIFTATGELRPDISLAGIAYLVVVGVGFFFVVSSAERLLIPWHQSVRAAAVRQPRIRRRTRAAAGR